MRFNRVDHITISNGRNDEVLNFARTELRRYLDRIFAAGGNRPIDIELTVHPRDGLKHDGFRIEITDEKIAIGSALPRGVLHGCYELLKLLGCLFVFPGAEHEYVPSLAAAVLDNGVRTKNPAFEFRGLCLYNVTDATVRETIDAIDLMAKNGFNFLLTSMNRLDDSIDGCHAILWVEISERVLPEIRKRGLTIDLSEHSTDYFFPPERWFPEHPEWFALYDGARRPGQLCYSNADVVRAYAGAYADFVRKHDFFDFIGAWPHDGGKHCQCEACVNDPYALLNSNRAIAGEIGKIRPELTVEHLAYTPESFSRPAEDLPRNMCVLVCGAQDERAGEWAEKSAGGGAFYFDYHTGDHYCFRANLWINPHYIRSTLRTLKGYGFRGIVSLALPITAWWVNSINYQIMSEYYYEPEAEPERVVRELGRKLFGGQPAMLEAWSRMVNRLQDCELWSRPPFQGTKEAVKIDRRDTAADLRNRERFDAELHAIRDVLKKVDRAATPAFQRQQAEILCEYLALQEIYYQRIDQYDFKRHTPREVEPYFEKLAALRQRWPGRFISPEYARWRIAGRYNNILIR